MARISSLSGVHKIGVAAELTVGQWVVGHGAKWVNKSERVTLGHWSVHVTN